MLPLSILATLGTLYWGLATRDGFVLLLCAGCFCLALFFGWLESFPRVSAPGDDSSWRGRDGVHVSSGDDCDGDGGDGGGGD